MSPHSPLLRPLYLPFGVLRSAVVCTDRENNLRALVIDLLQNWFLQYQDRTNNTHRHETWLDAYLGPSGGVGDGGASKYGMPVRIDQSLPSDHLASAVLNWPAVVSARIGGDMDGGSTWSQMASTGAFLSALHIRPIMDVLWTEAVQPDNTEHIARRANIEHELIIALLTSGPVGFGDSLPNKGFAGTNVTRLLLASRSDGVLLKPAHTALRLDVAPPNPEGAPRPGHKSLEVWAAPAVPARPSASGFARSGAAGLKSAATDRRANSLARLANVDGSADASERWWYTLLATDVNSAESPAGQTCAPVGAGGKAELTMAQCSEGSMLQLQPDGSLRTEAGGCVTHTEGKLSLGTGSSCAKFRSDPDGSLRAEGADDAELCLSNNAGSLSLSSCTPTLDGQTWTTTDSLTGAYVEQGSKHGIEIVADQAKSSLDIKFVPPAAWTEANCSLSADGTVCTGGHFSGGPIGKMYPTCRWDASVKGDSVVLDGWRDCNGTHLEAHWVKTGFIAGKAGVQQREGGACASVCGASGGSAAAGTQITTEMLFPVPPTGLSFVVRTFGKACSNGEPAASCLSVSVDQSGAAQQVLLFTPPRAVTGVWAAAFWCRHRPLPRRQSRLPQLEDLRRLADPGWRLGDRGRGEQVRCAQPAAHRERPRDGSDERGLERRPARERAAADGRLRPQLHDHRRRGRAREHHGAGARRGR